MAICVNLGPSPHDYSQFIINHDFAGTTNRYDHLSLLGRKRPDYPGVCYHVRIAMIPEGESTTDKNYEIVFQNGQWEVLSGDYAPDLPERPGLKIARLPAADQLRCLKTFPHDKFLAARSYCVQASDPHAGQIVWGEPAEGIVPSKTYLNLTKYQITLPGGVQEAPASYIAEVLGNNIEDRDGVNLDKKLGGFPTLAAAQTACQEHYETFAEKYYADTPFGGLPAIKRRQWYGKVKHRTVEQPFAPQTHYWVEVAGAGKNFYLAHPERLTQEFVISNTGDKFQAYLINNRHVDGGFYALTETEDPEIISLGESAAVAPLKQLCEEAFAAEVRRKPLIGGPKEREGVEDLIRERTGELMKAMCEFILPPPKKFIPPLSAKKREAKMKCFNN